MLTREQQVRAAIKAGDSSLAKSLIKAWEKQLALELPLIKKSEKLRAELSQQQVIAKNLSDTAETARKKIDEATRKLTLINLNADIFSNAHSNISNSAEAEATDQNSAEKSEITEAINSIDADKGFYNDPVKAFDGAYYHDSKILFNLILGYSESCGFQMEIQLLSRKLSILNQEIKNLESKIKELKENKKSDQDALNFEEIFDKNRLEELKLQTENIPTEISTLEDKLKKINISELLKHWDKTRKIRSKDEKNIKEKQEKSVVSNLLNFAECFNNFIDKFNIKYDKIKKKSLKKEMSNNGIFDYLFDIEYCLDQHENLLKAWTSDTNKNNQSAANSDHDEVKNALKEAINNLRQSKTIIETFRGWEKINSELNEIWERQKKYLDQITKKLNSRFYASSDFGNIYSNLRNYELPTTYCEAIPSGLIEEVENMTKANSPTFAKLTSKLQSSSPKEKHRSGTTDANTGDLALNRSSIELTKSNSFPKIERSMSADDIDRLFRGESSENQFTK